MCIRFAGFVFNHRLKFNTRTSLLEFDFRYINVNLSTILTMYVDNIGGFFMNMFKNTIQVIHGDITKAKVDCVVNAANQSLIQGGGVDQAIHQAAGSELGIALKTYGHCKTGEAVLTSGFKLDAKAIIHAVGPIWDEHGNKLELNRLLRKTYESIYKLAYTQGFNSIAIPNISTGVYAFPKEEAAKIAIDETNQFLKQHHSAMTILFYCFEKENYFIYRNLLNQ